jgi:hypothetical protein
MYLAAKRVELQCFRHLAANSVTRAHRDEDPVFDQVTAASAVLWGSVSEPDATRGIIKGDGQTPRVFIPPFGVNLHLHLPLTPLSRPGASSHTTRSHIIMFFLTLLPVVVAAAGALAQGVGQGKQPKWSITVQFTPSYRHFLRDRPWRMRYIQHWRVFTLLMSISRRICLNSELLLSRCRCHRRGVRRLVR